MKLVDQWKQVGAKGSLWKLVRVNGSRWKQMEVNGSRYASSLKPVAVIEVDGSLWKLLEFSELVEVYEIYGSSWQ